MSKKKLLGIDLDDLINESLKGLLFEVAEDESTANMKEKLKQQEKIKKSSDRKARMKKASAGDAGDEGTEIAPSKPVKLKHEKVPEITAQSIADKINELRAGKSLKDKETMSALKAYFEKLNGPERIALFAFLSGLVKVLGEAKGDVKTPHSKPFSIDMAQDSNVHTKRDGDKIPPMPKGTKAASAGKKSETPIVVGESANKKHILNVIKRNRRR